MKIFWNWDIHYVCNYRCSYCFLAKNWDIGAKMNRYPGLKKWSDAWNRVYDKYGSSHIHISGGEPFIYPDFLDYIILLSERFSLEFSTNLSFDVAFFIRKMNCTKVKLNASFHPEFADLNSFIKAILLLKSNNFLVSVSFVAYPPHLKMIYDLKREFGKNKIDFIVQPFRGEYEKLAYPTGYTEPERDLLRLYGANSPTNTIILDYYLKEGQEDRKLCLMGKMYGKVYPSADVHRCCSTKAEKIGNLLDDVDFSLLDEPAPCEINDCACWRRMIAGEEKRWISHWQFEQENSSLLGSL